MYVDSHCHLQDIKYKDVDIDSLIKRAIANDVKIMIVSGYDEESSIQAVALAKKYKEVYATVGYHPSEASKVMETDLLKIEKLLKEEKIVAIGEIGLDYHYDNVDKKAQQELFIKQLRLANKYKKPIVVHSRDSINDTYEILKKHKDINLKGVMHCYASNYETAKKFMDLNLSFGVGGVVTYKNNHITKDFVVEIGLNKLLLETDAPYLSPEPQRGRLNEPATIPFIADRVAEIKGLTTKEVMEQTTLNARAIFDI